MPAVTYYVALPFVPADDGVAAGEATECHSARQAMTRAAAMAAKGGGGVAFSRTGDPLLGDFEPAVVLATYGEVPSDLADL